MTVNRGGSGRAAGRARDARRILGRVPRNRRLTKDGAAGEQKCRSATRVRDIAPSNADIPQGKQQGGRAGAHATTLSLADDFGTPAEVGGRNLSAQHMTIHQR